MSLVIEAGDMPRAKLPFWQTIGLAYSSYFRNFGDVLRICWLWLLVTSPVVAATNWLRWSILNSWTAEIRAAGKSGVQYHQPSMPLQISIAQCGSTLLLLLCGASIAVAWHRRLILNETPRLSGSNIVSENLWRYVGIGFLISLTIVLPYLVVGLFVQFLGGIESLNSLGGVSLAAVLLIINFFAIALMLEWCLLLPARAVGSVGLTFKETSGRTEGNIWRLFWGIVVCTWPPIIAAGLVMREFTDPNTDMIGSGWFLQKMVISSTIFDLFYLLITPITVGFISYAYLHFFEPERYPSSAV